MSRGRKNQRCLLPHVQHVTYFRPSKDQGFQFSRLDGNLSCDALLDLGDAAALVVGNLAFIGLVGPVVIHGARPEAVVDVIARHDLFRLFRQRQ